MYSESKLILKNSRIYQPYLSITVLILRLEICHKPKLFLISSKLFCGLVNKHELSEQVTDIINLGITYKGNPTP